MKSIQSKVEAVVNIKYEDDDVVEIVNGPAQNAKDVKKETSNAKQEKNETPATNETENETKSEEKVAAEENKDDAATKSQETEITVAENMDLDDKE